MRKANMLMVEDGEIDNRDGTRRIDLLFHWRLVRMRLLACSTECM